MPIVIFIVGPTGVGKTEISIKLAKKINGEIICCDSMQVYKGMQILTAKPTTRQMSAVPHHLFGVIPPTENFSVAKYRKLALKKIKEIHKRKKTPIFVGGTGLYVQALLDGLFSSPAEDIKLRKKWPKKRRSTIIKMNLQSSRNQPKIWPCRKRQLLTTFQKTCRKN